MTSPEPPAEPGRPRRRGRPGHDREAVLRAAIAVFNRQGYDAASISDVAAELGVTKSAVYHHVASKEELLQAALDEALEGLTGAVESAGSGDRPAGARLHDLVRESVLILVDHLPAVTLLLRVRGNSAAEQEALARRRVIDVRFADLVRVAAEHGEVRDDLDPDLLSRLLFGLVNSLVEWYHPGGPVSREQLADAVTALALDGLTGPR